MKIRVKAQSRSGRPGDASDEVRDRIRRDPERADETSAMQKLVEEGLERDIGFPSKEQMFEAALMFRALEGN